MHELTGRLRPYGRVGILVSRYNELVTRRLLEGAREVCSEAGISEAQIDVVWVPGAFELPAVASCCAATGRYACLVALGAVIRGDTPHFDYVCDAVTRGIGAAMRAHQIPIGFGVLTTDDVQQAMQRAGSKDANKGYEALLTVIEMVHLIRAIG